MTTPKPPFTDRMFLRFQRAMTDAKQARQTFEEVLPVLQKSVRSKPDAIRGLEELTRYFREEHSEMEAAVGRMLEEYPIVATHPYDLAHLQTFVEAMEVYFTRELVTVVHGLEVFDPPLLQQALGQLSDERFEVIEETIRRAVVDRKEKIK